jgi:starch synthase
MKKVLFVASESTPYAKSGGLADVAGSLPKELLKAGYDISVVIPKYKEISQELEYFTDFPIIIGERKETCIVRFHKQKVGNRNLTTYFIDNYYYFDRPGMYCHFDEGERFAFFDRAIFELINLLKPNIVHLNDWQSGPIAALLKEKSLDFDCKVIYTIHNLEYNGEFGKEILKAISFDDSYFTPEKLEFYGGVSFTKAGIMYSDIVTTVSETYAEEIQTEAYGYRYEGLLKEKAKQNKLIGIVNGIDYDYFNPASDSSIWKNYNSEDISGKYENKRKLQKELNLPEKNVPMFSIVSRVVSHKGLDILLESLNEIIKEDIQFVLLGVGDQFYIDRFKSLKEKYQDKISINEVFDQDLAKKIYAGSDMFFMPSTFEPCGLSQLISFRYGTIPIARITGGLKDTVIGYVGDKKNGNGFTFWGNNYQDLLDVTYKALAVYQNKNEWETLVRKVMKQDFSWKHSAKEYQKIYNE